MTHSPRWQALSCARVTLAPLLPLRSRKGQGRNNHLFYCVSLSVSHINTHAYSNFNYFLGFCISMLLCAFHLCAHSLFVYVVFYANRASSVCESAHWPSPCWCWHTLTDGDRKAFILAEEFAL